MGKTHAESSSEAGRAVVYLRCSTAEQQISGLGLTAQQEACEAAAQRSGDTILTVLSDTCSGSTPPLKRPGLREALQLLESGKADRLLVSRLDRASRSVLDLCGLLRSASEQGWSFVAIDLGVDTASPFGKAMTQIASTFAELERELIAQRTCDALRVAKASGTRLGRPSLLAGSTKERIAQLRADGLTFKHIAGVLMTEGIKTSRGNDRWWPSSVQAALVTVDLDEYAAARSTTAA